MERNWRLGDDVHPKDSLFDGFTFEDVITALHTESVVNEKTARRVLNEIMEIRLQDMNFLFEKNLDVIIAAAMKGRG